MPTKSIQERFEQFHADNPDVYETLVREAFKLKAAGFTTAAIGLLWERLRWINTVEVRRAEGDTYTLNNDFRSRYARLLMEREADLAGFFTTRVLVEAA